MTNSFFDVSSYVQCLRTVFIALCLLVGTGCNLSDSGVTSYLPPDKYFAVLELEHHSINLSTKAPYDTVTLKSIGTMGDGSTVPGDISYSVNHAGISVTDDGVLKAVSTVTGAVVRIQLTYGTITRTDSAFVTVIADVPNHLSEFGIGLLAADSAKLAAGEPAKMIPLIRNSVSGTNLSAILVSVRSTDSTVASINQAGNNLIVRPKRAGRVVLYTSTYAYGTAWQDSLVFTVGWSITFNIPVYEKFLPGGITKMLEFGHNDFTVGVGACVVWNTQSMQLDADVVFDDPSHVSAPIGMICGFSVYDPTISGNIAPYRLLVFPVIGEEPTPEEFDAYRKAFFSSRQARVFSTSGLYPYRSTIHGTSGIIRVCDEQNDTRCAPAGIGAWY